MDCYKKRASAVGNLPVDPLVEILSRVPAKSVCRFKCVSKAWRDLIADPHHRKKLPQVMEGLFLQSEDAHSFSFIDLAARSVPLGIDPSFSFLTEQPGIRFLYFSDSCNGLVLFQHDEEPGSAGVGYIVCNPTTKEWKVVPACRAPTSTSVTYCYLAFDPAVSSHFNLVQFQLDDNEEFFSVHAYSSETGTWSGNQIDEQGQEQQFQGWRQVKFDRFDSGELNPRCPFVSGFLHLIVLDQDQIKIVALDVQGKVRRMIPVPQVPDRSRWICYFGESKGQLHYMTEEMVNARERKYKLSIWVLQDYGAQEWVLKGTVNTNEVFDELVEDVEVADIHQHRNVVFFTHSVDLPAVRICKDHCVIFAQSSEHKLVAYDMDRKEVSTIATFDDNECRTARYVPYF